jgi:hypothetical protein
MAAYDPLPLLQKFRMTLFFLFCGVWPQVEAGEIEHKIHVHENEAREKKTPSPVFSFLERNLCCSCTQTKDGERQCLSLVLV